MCTSTNIRRHIFRLGRGIVFTTRDMLHHGRRAAVDQTLSRLVNSGVLRRLARGVFIRSELVDLDVSVAEVVKVKARAFGKKVMTHAHDCAVRAGLIPGPTSAGMFQVSGHSSSFLVLSKNVRVFLSGVSARKFRLGESPHGQLMRALWYLDSTNYRSPNYGDAISRLSRVERLEMNKKARWVPSWLSDLICHQRH